MSYHPGDHYVICDQCGFRRLASECRMQWDGLFVCADTCYDEKHPLLFQTRQGYEKQNVRIRRPEGEDNFI